MNGVLGLILILIPPALLIWAVSGISKNKERTEKLFTDELYPMCNSAKTAQQIKDAFEQLHLKCLDIKSMQEYLKKNGGMFKIDIAYKSDFHYLKAKLQGKWEMLSEEERKSTRNGVQ